VSLPEISSGKSSLSVWGDSVVGQALVLLLRSCGYEANLLRTWPLDQPLLLQGSDSSSLLLITPTPQLSPKKRQAFLSALRSTPETATIPVLELRMIGEEAQEEEQSAIRDDSSWHYVSWPCRIEVLAKRIEALIPLHYGKQRRGIR
jgi:hypothetical protein